MAAFDPKKLIYVVLGHPDISFPGEDAARRAGCIVMPQGPRVGDVRGLSSTEPRLYLEPLERSDAQRDALATLLLNAASGLLGGSLGGVVHG